MLFNLLIAKAHYSKPILTIIVKVFLNKFVIRNVSVKPLEVNYCSIVEREQKLIDFNLDRVEISEIAFFKIAEISIDSKLNRDSCNIFNIKTFNYLVLKSALKSHNSLLNLAKRNFESKIVETLIARLNQPSPLQQEIVTRTVKSGSLIAIDIISSFDISEKKRSELIKTIKQTIATKAKIKFRLAIDSKSKIELHAKEFKIYWNLKHYLIEVKTAISSEEASVIKQRKTIDSQCS